MPSDFMDVQSNFVPFGAQVTSVLIVPANESTYSWFSINFSFNVHLQPGTLVKIQVSALTVSLSDQIGIECYARSGFSLFQDCNTLSDNDTLFVAFTLMERCSAGTEMTLDVVGYSRFVVSKTDPGLAKAVAADFYVSAYSNNVLLASSTDLAAQPAYLYKTSDVLSLDVVLTIDPINSGEIARYFFEFTFDSLQIEATDQIWVRFPLEYDINLGGRELQVEATIRGAFKVKRRNRDLFVYDLLRQNLKTGLLLEIFGIQNPNRNSKNQISDFSAGVLGRDFQLKASASSITGPLLIAQPDILELVNLGSSSQIFRTDNALSLLLDSREIFPDSNKGGALKILFSQDFILDVFYARCSTQDAYALYSFCTLKDNLLAVDSANRDYDSRTTGAIGLNVTNIRNGEDVGASGNLIAYSANSKDKTIISRSFPNLSRSFLDFESDGLDLIINENLPIQLEVGSFSDPISVRANEPIKQRINLIPLYYDSSMLFSRNPITLAKASPGEFFSLAVPQDMLHNRFYITLAKAGDLFPQFYASLAKLAVDVLPVTNRRTVTFEDTLYANRGGMSVPMQISTLNFPYRLVRVDIKVTNDAANQVILKNSFVELTNISGAQYFRVDSIAEDFPHETLELEYTLSGDNSDSFQLMSSILSIKIHPRDYEAPTLVALVLNSANRSSARFNVTCDRLCYVHCLLGYRVV